MKKALSLASVMLLKALLFFRWSRFVASFASSFTLSPRLSFCVMIIKTKAMAIYAICGDKVLSSNLIVIGSEESST